MSSVMDMGADADTLVAGIDAGDIDPESVDIRPFVEDDDKVLTPELAERLPDEKVERYNELAAERDANELRQEAVNLSSEERSALDKLRPDETGQYDTITLPETDVDVRVRTYTTGRVEESVENIASAAQSGEIDLSAIRSDMIDVLSAQIEDDQYGQREVWRAYADEYGLKYLMKNAMAVMDPALSAIEDQQSFRSD